MSAQTHPCAQLLAHFASVEGPRIERTKEHLLINLIVIYDLGSDLRSR